MESVSEADTIQRFKAAYESDANEIDDTGYSTEIWLTPCLPEGVTELLTLSRSRIGIVDELTLMKFPLDKDDREELRLHGREAEMYARIGPHNRIIGFKGLTEHGILLERACFGSIVGYLGDNDPDPQLRQKWIRQATEALAVVHSKDILHCDISVRNILLDRNLDVKMADLQGRFVGPDGRADPTDTVGEGTKSWMPRSNPMHADRKTDIFALGSAIYHIMEGHEVYPELDAMDDDDEQLIEEKFSTGNFPKLECSWMNSIIHKCWSGEYDSADLLLRDLKLQMNGSVVAGSEVEEESSSLQEAQDPTIRGSETQMVEVQ